MVRGKLNDTYTNLVSSAEGWFYAMNGRVTEEFTGLVENENGNWYVENGAVSLTHEGLVCDESGWWYVVDSHVAEDYTGFAKNENGTWYVQNGYLDFGFSGKVTFDGEEYEVSGGYVIGGETAGGEEPPATDYVDVITYFTENEAICDVGAGILITKKDGKYGVVSYDGEEILSHEFTGWWHRITADGYFALETAAGQVEIYNKFGEKVYSLEIVGDECELTVMRINEGVVTYSYTATYEPDCYKGAYDLELAKEIEFLDDEDLSNIQEEKYITAMKDGKFYFGVDDELYEVDRTGELKLLYKNRFCEGLPGGEVRFNKTPRDGYCTVYIYNDYVQEYRFGLMSVDGQDVRVFEIEDFADALGIDWSTCSIKYFIEDGVEYGNLNQQVVLDFKLDDGTRTKYMLLDFSNVEYEEREIRDYWNETYVVGMEKLVSNLNELIVAQYDSIEMSPTGNYLASDGDDWFYINSSGQVVADYVDCAAFAGEYAAIKDTDGLVYVIDTNFNKVSAGYEADSVHTAGNGFVLVNGNEYQVLIVNE